ncbi:MAG: metallophosphoesterase family protein [Kiritimatiellae bacterium]|nr:metallophosphoesterase family protein [Kiritimatiellia bacterium]
MMARIVCVLLPIVSAMPAFAAIGVNAYAITPSPTAVMVTFANGPDSRGFSWQTDMTVTESEVRLVAGAASLADFETTPLVYTGSCVQVADMPHGTTPLANCHKVIIKNLQPGTAYSYRLGGAGHYVYGRTDVKPRTSNKFTIVNLNDAQMKDPTKVAIWENSLAASVMAVCGVANVDFIINGGDLFDQNLKVNNAYVTVPIKWSIVLDPVFAFYNGVPFVSSSGNHDYREYGTRMPIEYPTNLAGCESLDYGNVHIATIPNTGSDTYSGYVNYLNWLESDLAANVARGTSTWRIVCVHFGPYTTGDHAQTAGGKELAKRLGGICAANKVDLVLQAHDHTFSKTLPYRWSGTGWTNEAQDNTVVNLTPATCTYAGETWDENPNGTYYLSCGSAGHRVGEGTEYANLDGAHPYNEWTPIIAIGKIAVASKWGNVGDPASSDLGRSMFGVIRVDGYRLSYDFYMIDSDDGSHVLYDKLRVSKTPPSGASSTGLHISLSQNR